MAPFSFGNSMEKILDAMLKIVRESMWKEIEDNKGYYQWINYADAEPKVVGQLACSTMACPVATSAPAKIKKKGKPMRYQEFDSESPLSVEDRKFNYLEGRLFFVMDRKETELRDMFNLNAMKTPVTPDEVRERLAAGLFTLPTDEVWKADRHYYGSALGYIEWRDPSKPADMEGFQKAYKVLSDERTKVLDAIQILSPDAGLSAVQAFENWTYTV